MKLITNRILHDKSDNQYARDTVAKPADSNEDRTVTYQDGSTVKQKEMTAATMTWEDTQNFITYAPLEKAKLFLTVKLKPENMQISLRITQLVPSIWQGI